MTPTTDVTDRERFLQMLGDLSGGESGMRVPLHELAQRLNLPQEDAVLLAESLCAGMPGSAYHGLIEPCDGEDFSEVGITDEGLAFLESVPAVSSL